MKYKELVAMWNEESSEQWCDISEDRKIEFAFDEGRRTGFIEIAEIAEKLSESERLL
jgi:hypothetical protein